MTPLNNLAKPGRLPATLVDVSVGTGTTGLHEAFPDARHVVAVMADHGLRLCDILTASRSRQREIIQVDAMFGRDDHKI